MSREARDVLERLELDLSSEINQREDRFNVAPTQRALVVTAAGEGVAEAGLFRWGLVPSWAKDTSIGTRLMHDPVAELTELGFAATLTMARAIARGVYHATTLPVPGAQSSWQDRFGTHT